MKTVKESQLTQDWYTTGQLAKLCGCNYRTIGLHHHKGLIVMVQQPSGRLIASKDEARRYFQKLDLYEDDTGNGRFVAGYVCAESTAENPGALLNEQTAVLIQSLARQQKPYRIFQDIGSFADPDRVQLQKLLGEVKADHVKKIVVTDRRQLASVGYGYLKILLDVFQTEVETVPSSISSDQH